MMDNARGPFFPDLIEDLQLSDTKASLFFAVPSLVSFLGSHLTQHFIFKMGTLWTLRGGLLLLAGGFAAIGMAFNFASFLLFCAVFGFGLGVVNVAQNVAIQEGAKPEHRRRLFSGLHSMYAFSSVIAPLVVGPMVKWGMGWRFSFFVFAGVGLLALVYTVPLKTLPHAPSKSAASTDDPDQRRHFLYVALMFSAYMVGELLISSRLVLFVRRVHEVSAVNAPFYLAAFFAFLLAGRLLFTFVHFRHLSNTKIMAGGFLISSASMLAGLFYSPWFLSLSALGMAPIFGIAMDFVSEIFHKKAVAALAYCMSLSALFIVAMHFVAGVLTENFSLTTALLLGPAVHVIGALLVVGHPYFFKK